MTEMVFKPPRKSIDHVGECTVGEFCETRRIAIWGGRIFGIHRLRSCLGHAVDDVIEKLLLACDRLWSFEPLLEGDCSHDKESRWKPINGPRYRLKIGI